MVRAKMVAFVDADFREIAVVAVALEDEGGHAGVVRQEGQMQHVQIEPDIFRKAGGNAGGGGDARVGMLAGGGFRALDALLDFAHAGEEFIEFLIVPRGERAAHAAGLTRHVIEHGTLLRLAHQQALLALGGVLARAEEPLEQQARVGFRRQGRGGRTPGKVVLIDTDIPAVAGAGVLHGVAGNLQRGEGRQMAHLLRRDLVDGDAGVEVGAQGFLDAHGGEEGAARSGRGRRRRRLRRWRR